MENKSQYELGLIKGVGIVNQSLPFRIFRYYQITPDVYELVGAFKTRELAEDFIEYQATIDRKTRYRIEEISGQ